MWIVKLGETGQVERSISKEKKSGCLLLVDLHLVYVADGGSIQGD
jgi:hypothetical protein